MKSNKICPQHSAFHDEPSNVKLESVIDFLDPEHTIHQIEIDIFNHLQVKFKVNEVYINEEEHLHTIFVATKKKEKKHMCFFLGHGFGGSSLMYFPIITMLLEYGNVVLWEIRGMGLAHKLDKYNVSLQESETFFVHPIELMLKFYQKYKQIFLISHSFGGYLTLLYIMKYKTYIKNIKQVILLSPVGITPKELDYKSQMKSFSDCMHVVGNQLSWRFHVTYKSPFRCICACFKNRVFADAVKDCGFTKEEQRLMKNLLIAMVQLKDGSEGVFFNYFEPRVLPKFPIEPIFNECPDVKISIFYGGQEDWVDKKGAQHLQARYPQKISIKIVKQCGHNFPFSPQLLKQNLEQVMTPYKTFPQQNSSHQTNKPKKVTIASYHEEDSTQSKKSKKSHYEESSDESFKHEHKHVQIPIN